MAERILLPKGTKEHIPVDVTDRLANLTTLTGTAARFDIRRRGETTYIVTAAVATTIGLTAYCLVDTSTSDFTNPGRYELYLQFDNLPESPRLGPFEFEVNA